MIIRTRTGVRVSGTLRWDGSTKPIGSKRAFVLTIRAHSEKQPDGQWLNYDVNARIWGDHPELEEMFLKGDFVAVEGPEIEDRPGSDGKIYHNLTADDVTPGARVILRWMQQQIDICYEMIEGVPSPSGEGAVPPVEGAVPPSESAVSPSAGAVRQQDSAVYPYGGAVPRSTGREGTTGPEPASESDLERLLDETDEQDLPF